MMTIFLLCCRKSWGGKTSKSPALQPYLIWGSLGSSLSRVRLRFEPTLPHFKHLPYIKPKYLSLRMWPEGVGTIPPVSGEASNRIYEIVICGWPFCFTVPQKIPGHSGIFPWWCVLS